MLVTVVGNSKLHISFFTFLCVFWFRICLSTQFFFFFFFFEIFIQHESYSLRLPMVKRKYYYGITLLYFELLEIFIVKQETIVKTVKLKQERLYLFGIYLIWKYLKIDMLVTIVRNFTQLTHFFSFAVCFQMQNLSCKTVLKN